MKTIVKLTSVICALALLLSTSAFGAFAASDAEQEIHTSINSRYESEFYETLLNYPDLEKTTMGSFPIPGLEITCCGSEICDLMTPQGICVTGKYILISAYCNIGKELEGLDGRVDASENNQAAYEAAQSHQRHNSVIYMLNRTDHGLIRTVKLPDKHHVGGIAFDGTYLWIAQSDSNDPGNNYLQPILFSDFRGQVLSSPPNCEISYTLPACPCNCIASFVTYSSGRLWVGEFSENSGGQLVGFEVDRSNADSPTISRDCSLPLPPCTNGAAFTDGTVNKDGKYLASLIVNTSYGRRKNSLMTVYTVDLTDDAPIIVGTENRFTMPPMIETICVDGFEFLTLFESAATPYSTIDGNKCEDIVDRVCVGRIVNLTDNYSHPAPYYSGNVEYYTPTGEHDARYVPNMIVGGDEASYGVALNNRLLFNPETALMLHDMSVQAYKLEDGDFSWENKLANDYGYEQFAYSKNNGSYLIGTIDEQQAVENCEGSYEVINVQQEKFLSACNAIISLKKVTFNGREIYAVAVAFRGTSDIADFLADINVFQTFNNYDIHDGFEGNARDFLEECKTLTFRIDGLTVSLYDMIEDMCNFNSKYRMLVTGHSLGAAVADIFVGELLYNIGVRENVAAYTFAAPKTVSSYYGEENQRNNIFNIINADDVIPKIGASDHIGINIVFEPDDEFRAENYGGDYSAGHDSGWWSAVERSEIPGPGGLIVTEFSARCLAPHAISGAYKSIIQRLSSTSSDGEAYIHRYTPYHTNGNITFSEGVAFNANSFMSFEGSITADFRLNLASNPYPDDNRPVNLCVGGNLELRELNSNRYENRLSVSGNFTLREYATNHFDGELEVKGDYTQLGSMDGLNKVILSGDSVQTVTFSRQDEYNTFDFLSLENENVFFATPVYGFIMANPSVINCDVTVINRLDTNAYPLTVNGSLTTGELICSGSDLTVLGSLKTQSVFFDHAKACVGGNLEAETCNVGFAKLWVSGNMEPNCLTMNSAFNRMTVLGDLILSGNNGMNYGTIDLKGDFKQVGQQDGCFVDSSSVHLIFSGSKRQYISFDNPTENNSLPRHISFKNPEVDFLTPVYSLNLIEDAVLNCTLPLTIVRDLNIVDSNAVINAGINTRLVTLFSANAEISGDLSADENIFLNTGSSLKAGGNLKSPGLMSIDASSLETVGNAEINSLNMLRGSNIKSGGSLSVNNSNAVYNPDETQVNTIELKGNLNLSAYLGKNTAFIFSGDGEQRVSSNLEDNNLETVIIENTSPQGVVFEKRVGVGTLFDHKGNSFTLLYPGESWFNDYDLDGLRDNVDPFPTVPFIRETGDTNGDGEINIMDATVIQKFIAGRCELTGSALESADANGDGTVDVNDVTHIQKYAAKLIDRIG